MEILVIEYGDIGYRVRYWLYSKILIIE